MRDVELGVLCTFMHACDCGVIMACAVLFEEVDGGLQGGVSSVPRHCVCAVSGIRFCVCAALHRAVCHDNRCGAVCGAAALVCTKNNAKTGMPLT